MQKPYANIFVAIISCSLLLLTAILINFNFEVRSSYAIVDKKKPPQQLPHNSEKKLNNEKIMKIFGAQKPTHQNLSVEEINKQINSFFAYLDQQNYIKRYNLAQGSQNQFNQIIEILIHNSPVLVRETDSIHDVLKNYFYFYRLLGKDRINYIMDILANESGIIEPLMYVFYKWFKTRNDESDPNLTRPSLENAYIYANFLLETIGGRNYLFRRNPKVRKLASYYCILIIDQANMQGLNSNGIDIRPHLKLTYNDLADQIDLAFKNQYLWQLENLRKKYKLS